MAVENDRRFERWRLALKMIVLREAAEAVKHLPDADPARLQAEADFRAARAVYELAAAEGTAGDLDGAASL
jgi:hypothetical protein